MIGSYPPQPTEERRTAAEMAGETEGFDVAKALDTDGFSEFLAMFTDVKDTAISPEDMEERFEVFEMKNEVAKQLKEAYKAEIAQEIGVRFDSKDLACIDAYLDKKAVEDPSTLSYMKDTVQQYHDLPIQIASARQEMDNLADISGFNARITRLRKEDETMELATKGVSTWGKIKMYASVFYGAITDKHTQGQDVFGARWEAQQRGVPLTREALDARRIEITGEAFEEQKRFQSVQAFKAEELVKMGGRLAGIKEELFAYAGLKEEIAAIAGTKLKNNILSVVSSTGGGLEKFSKSIEGLSEKSIGSTTGLEYIAGADEEQMRQDIDAQAEAYVMDIISKKIDAVKPGKNAFSKFRASLKEIISSEKLGSKDADASRSFIVDSLRGIANGLPTDIQGIQKRIFVNQIIDDLRG